MLFLWIIIQSTSKMVPQNNYVSSLETFIGGVWIPNISMRIWIRTNAPLINHIFIF
jgi:hypothetical protein